MTQPVAVDLIALRPVLDQQSGVVSRRQVLEHGGDRSDLRRWLRARELVPVHKGVYVNHTGPLTWSSRAWAGVQRFWPAALGLESATNLAGDVIHVVVAEGRSSTVDEPKVKVHRIRDFESRVRLDRSPPTQDYEDAVLSVCGSMDRRKALQTISEACRSRRTTPARLHEELTRRTNLADRAWLLGLLDDAAAGVQSVLESIYLRKVERAHDLPRGERQLREDTVQGVVYRDVLYRAFGVGVELDGRLGHEAFEDRADDLTRDLLSATEGRVTLRIGWRQSELESCATASAIGLVLRQRGWSGSPARCGPDCLAA